MGRMIFMDVSKEYYPILEQSGMMRGIAPQRYGTVLFCLQARTVDYPRGVYVAEVGEAPAARGFCFAAILRNFFTTKMETRSPSLIFMKDRFWRRTGLFRRHGKPVCLRTASDCTVMLLDLAYCFESSMGCLCRMQVTANLMQEFARQVLAFNTKVRILGQKRLRDRLKIYLQTLTPDDDGMCIPCHIRVPHLPIFCVDRSALSRELCRMRDEGILSFSGSKVSILDPGFLHA